MGHIKDYQADHCLIDHCAWSGSHWLNTGYTHYLCILLIEMDHILMTLNDVCDASSVSELRLHVYSIYEWKSLTKSIKLLYVLFLSF